MRKRIALVGICCLGLLAIGSHPRYLEELRIGGGYGDGVDGGADFDNSGNIAADGSVKATGGFEAGKDSTVRGVVTAWDGAGGNAPGSLKLGSTNGTVGYLFMSNDRSGLRLHSSLPISDTDGEWLKAKTVTDLSSPPAIGATTPNRIKGTTGEFTGALTAGSASNAVTIGTSCNMTAPPAVGGTTPNTARFSSLGLTGYAWTSGAELVKHYDRHLSFTSSGGWYEICRMDMGAAAQWASLGMLITITPREGSALGNVNAFIGLQKPGTSSYSTNYSVWGARNTYNIKIRDMGSNIYQVWAYGVAYSNCKVQVSYNETAAGLVDFSSFGVAGSGGSSDVAQNIPYTFGQNVSADGYLTTVGGVRVGGTSDPGTGNLVVAGDATLEGGDLVAGTAGATRGTVTIYRGAGTTTPGILKLVSPNGTTHYFFAEDDGTLKVHNALPSSNSNGIEIGSQFSSTITTFTADDTSPSVSAGLLFRVPGTWTAGNNITMFDDGIAGQQIVVIGGDADCAVVDGLHVKLAGNWTGAAGKTLSLVFDGMDWFETARADN